MKIRSIQYRRSRKFASVALIIVGLGGCTSKVAVEPGFVEGRWAETMGYYNFTAVFPPQDTMVGDVYLAFAPSNAQSAESSPEERAQEDKQRYSRYYFRLTRLNVKSLLKRDWQKRINLPSTAQSGKAVDIFATQTKFTTLPAAAFIGYNIVNITEGQAGVAFPVHLFRTFLGGAFEDQLALSISVPSAQLVELPGIDAFNVINNFCSGRKTKQYCEKPDWYAIETGNINDPVTFIAEQYAERFHYNPNTYTLGLIFVTDVLYAQSIQYSYSTENGSAFSAAVTPVAALSSQTKASGTTATSQTASEGGTTVNVNVNGNATATNGGATACATPAAKTDQNPADGSHSTDASGSHSTDASGSHTTDAAGSHTTDAAGSHTADGAGSHTTDATGSHATDAAGSHTTDASKNQKAEPTTASQDNGCGTGKPSTNTGAAPSNLTADAEARIQALEARVAALNQQLGTAGGTVTIASVSEQGTVLQQTFPSPVAIGYRGFSVGLEPRSGGQTIPARK